MHCCQFRNTLHVYESTVLYHCLNSCSYWAYLHQVCNIYIKYVYICSISFSCECSVLCLMIKICKKIQKGDLYLCKNNDEIFSISTFFCFFIILALIHSCQTLAYNSGFFKSSLMINTWGVTRNIMICWPVRASFNSGLVMIWQCWYLVLISRHDLDKIRELFLLCLTMWCVHTKKVFSVWGIVWWLWCGWGTWITKSVWLLMKFIMPHVHSNPVMTW